MKNKTINKITQWYIIQINNNVQRKIMCLTQPMKYISVKYLKKLVINFLSLYEI